VRTCTVTALKNLFEYVERPLESASIHTGLMAHRFQRNSLHRPDSDLRLTRAGFQCSKFLRPQVSAVAQRPWPWQWASTTTKFNCWADGAVTLTSYILIIHKPAALLIFPPNWAIHTGQPLSLRLSSSHIIWLSTAQPGCCERAEATTNYYCSAIHRRKHRERDPQCTCSMPEVI